MTPTELAVLFHDTYERLAPNFGYETRKDTRKFDTETPNGKLMISVCGEILRAAPAVPEGFVLVPLNLLNKVKPILGAVCASSNITEGAGKLRVKVYEELCAVIAAASGKESAK